MIRNVYELTGSYRKTSEHLGTVSKSTVEKVINNKYAKNPKTRGPKGKVDRYTGCAINKFQGQKGFFCIASQAQCLSQ